MFLCLHFTFLRRSCRGVEEGEFKGEEEEERGGRKEVNLEGVKGG